VDPEFGNFEEAGATPADDEFGNFEASDASNLE
jgi:hypothetical protein